MSEKPTLVMVPGAWHRAETWNKTAAGLEAEGYKCVSVTLPSTSGSPEAGFGDDVKAVQDAIRKETTQNRNVVVIVHSYGGMVGASAIKGFAKKPHDSTASPETTSSGHVIGLAMIATGFAVTGKNFLELIGGSPPPFWVADTETGFATLVVDTRDFFYHDLPEEEGRMWAGKLTKHSLKSLAEGGEYAYAGWKDVPCWYLVTLEDRGLPAELAHYAVKMARDEGGHVTAREVQSSHSPMLSKVKETVSFISDATADFMEKRNTTD